MKVLIESATVKLRQVKGYGGGVVGVFTEEVMTFQVILGYFDEVFGRRLRAIGEYLVKNMGTELLYANFVVS